MIVRRYGYTDEFWNRNFANAFTNIKPLRKAVKRTDKRFLFEQ